MSAKLNRLRSRFQSLKKELQHKIFMLSYSYKEFEKLQKRNKELEDTMNAIAKLEAYNEDSKQEIVYQLRVLRMELRYMRNQKDFIDYIFDTFKGRLYRFIDDTIH